MSEDLARRFKTLSWRFKHLEDAATLLNIKADLQSPYLNVVQPLVLADLPTKRLIYERGNTAVYDLGDLILKVYTVTASLRAKREIVCLRLWAYLGKVPHFILPYARALQGTQQMLVVEKADGSLWDLQSKLSPYQWCVLLFQTLYTLYIMRRVKPNFQHNDLHIGNVLIQRIDPELKYHSTYVYKNHFFYHDLYKCPYRVLLYDMYYASLSKPKQYCDIHQILDSVILVKTLPRKLRVFIDTYLPKELRCRIQGRTLKRQELPEAFTYDNLLEDPYFAPLMRRPRSSQGNLETYTSHDTSLAFTQS